VCLFICCSCLVCCSYLCVCLFVVVVCLFVVFCCSCLYVCLFVGVVVVFVYLVFVVLCFFCFISVKTLAYILNLTGKIIHVWLMKIGDLRKLQLCSSGSNEHIIHNVFEELLHGIFVLHGRVVR